MSTRSKVGMRYFEDQIDEPTCDTETWWHVANMLPLRAINSPLYSLLTLESPERWLAMEWEAARRWVFNSRAKLTDVDQRRFAADCAEHVLPLWETQYPSDHRPRHAIAVARAYANAQVNAKALEHAAQAAREARDKKIIEYNRFSEAANRAAQAACMAATQYDNNAAYQASLSAQEAVFMLAKSSDKLTAQRQEGVWQWHRLLAYYRGEVL